MKVLATVALLSAIVLGYIVKKNPLLTGRRTGESHDGLEIITSHPVLDAELMAMKDDIGQDYEACRNHCLRVMTFTKFHLPDTVEKSLPNAMDLVAVALAHHDAALWVEKKLSYLEPSAAHVDAKRGEYTDEEVEIMKDIVMYHHKYTDFKSTRSRRSSEADALVNAVRKSDWADASMGLVRYGLPAVLLEAAYDNIPESGFHMVLNDFPAKLSPDSLIGQLDVLKILKW